MPLKRKTQRLSQTRVHVVQNLSPMASLVTTLQSKDTDMHVDVNAHEYGYASANEGATYQGAHDTSTSYVQAPNSNSQQHNADTAQKQCGTDFAYTYDSCTNVRFEEKDKDCFPYEKEELPFQTLNEDGVNNYIENFGGINWKDGMKEFQNVHEFDDRLLENLERYWGYGQLRSMQREICTCSLTKQDCFVIMPTGYGKSLTYQLPTVCENGTTIVISPLVSLIQDQVYQLNESLGIKAVSLGRYEDGNRNEADAYSRIKAGEFKIVYVTPEKLEQSTSLRFLLRALHNKGKLGRFAIDECHCISQWGHDFRKSYLKLDYLRKTYPDVPIVAVTATATKQVMEDIVSGLGINGCHLFRQSMNRSNLHWSVRPKKKKGVVAGVVQWLNALQTKHNLVDPCGIIYCLTKKETETVAHALQEQGIQCVFYHGGLTPEERQKSQDQWTRDQVRLMVATCAFGMGINKYDVRFVVHTTMPKSVEDYYQQAGRAGRDGEPSWCVLYFTLADRFTVEFMISQTDEAKTRPPEFVLFMCMHIHISYIFVIERDRKKLYDMIYYCQNDVDCRRVCLLQMFGDVFHRAYCKDRGNGCDNCDELVTSNCSSVFREENCNVDSLAFVEIVEYLHRQNCNRKSYDLVLKIFRGSKCKDVIDTHAPQNLSLAYGKGANRTENDARRLLTKLLSEQVLIEEVQGTMYGSLTSTMQLGPKANAFRNGHLEIHLRVRVESKQKREKKKGKANSNRQSKAKTAKTTKRKNTSEKQKKEKSEHSKKGKATTKSKTKKPKKNKMEEDGESEPQELEARTYSEGESGTYSQPVADNNLTDSPPKAKVVEVGGYIIQPLADIYMHTLSSELHELRKQIRDEFNIMQMHYVFSDVALGNLARYGPSKISHLKHIEGLCLGFGSTLAQKNLFVTANLQREKYGKQIVTCISESLNQNGTLSPFDRIPFEVFENDNETGSLSQTSIGRQADTSQLNRYEFNESENNNENKPRVKKKFESTQTLLDDIGATQHDFVDR
ncbi:hypothetical protein RFI_01017 [Reticulomyxa filosa]|uniref:DNA 3'-5' helicase n=1 Tax=Reticulomyxa filosa TaxID=46433 RepID=X6PCV1_RETFI|nr:hypothetical protein RFI_01017 [Reticulomyxa filosa]|eukprot:ETO36046.1 hypothetical protein RFI_01017 [Reticulomyxa filosa]